MKRRFEGLIFLRCVIWADMNHERGGRLAAGQRCGVRFGLASSHFCSAPTSTGTLPLNTATPTRDLISQRFSTSDQIYDTSAELASLTKFERNIRKITSGFKKLVFLYPLFARFLSLPSSVNNLVKDILVYEKVQNIPTSLRYCQAFPVSRKVGHF